MKRPTDAGQCDRTCATCEEEASRERRPDDRLSTRQPVRKSSAERLAEDEVEKAERVSPAIRPEIRVDARSFKMSKSRGNVVNPDDIVADYGADTFRLYEMYMGPLEAQKPWNTRTSSACSGS